MTNLEPHPTGRRDDVRRLYDARRKGHEASLPAALETYDEALALQLEVADAFAADGDRIAGWKTALASGGSRDRLGAGFRPFGYVPESRLLHSGDSISYDRLLNCNLEPELCLVLDRPLYGTDVTEYDARAAVRSVAIAFEINEMRVPGGLPANPAMVLADGLGNWGVVIGDEVPASAFDLPGTSVEVFKDGQPAGEFAVGSDVTIDDPFLSLARMCRLLGRFGRGLETGQPVITGSFSHHAVTGPSSWSARMSRIGSVSVHFTGNDFLSNLHGGPE
jgi:2-keto-4-pentenoate hydratase